MADFVAGTVAGCAGQIVGHPLDSIKTRLQSEALLTSSSGQRRRQTSAYRCARSIYSEGGIGIRSFFRGLSLPLLSKGFEQSVAFGIKNAADELVRDSRAVEGNAVLRTGLSGAAAGATTATLLTPVYLVKVGLQVTSKHGRDGLAGPMAVIRSTYSKLGVAGLYTGAVPILIGTSIGYACRFVTYEQATEAMQTELGLGRTGACIVGGGLAGMATWASHYPLDLVSSRMEASVALGAKRRSMTGHFRQIYAESGVRGFYRGLGPCLLRAFPVNAAIFVTHDFVRSKLGCASWIQSSFGK